MTPNVGGMDRILRIVAGLALLSLFFLLEGNARYWGLIGIVPILTGTFRWCPAYLPFGYQHLFDEERLTSPPPSPARTERVGVRAPRGVPASDKPHP